MYIGIYSSFLFYSNVEVNWIMNLKALGSVKKDTNAMYYLPVKDNEKTLLLIKIILTRKVNAGK